MHCPKCHSENYIKNGIKYNKQRYKCKRCACHFTQSHKRGASLEKKLLALNLYLEGMELRSIGRVLKVNNVTVLNWIRMLGKSVKTYVQTHMPDDVRHLDVIEKSYLMKYFQKKNLHQGGHHLPLVIKTGFF